MVRFEIPSYRIRRRQSHSSPRLGAIGLCALVRVVLVLLVVLVGVGCASLRAARLYRSGTEAMAAGLSVRAVAELEQAAALAPQSSEIQNHLGLAYADLGRDAEALDSFQRAVDLDCNNAAARANLDRALAMRAARHGVADGR